MADIRAAPASTYFMSVRRPRSAAKFAASAAGAKERVAPLGAHLSMRDDAAPGPLTQASAPQAPGRLGREDARNFGCRTLVVLQQPVVNHLRPRLHAEVVDPHLFQCQKLARQLGGFLFCNVRGIT